ncbi:MULTISPECIES: hypothetical protein [Mycobacterium]|nr:MULTISPECIES: hypothetical protein [Mycobacterium]MCV7232768.1 hypothetical protein [Mycobacterium branderi]ORA40906.1 hypothetical protein BST20_01795 [Mycobacterium branderi]BBZ09866.1 hypothetical protein MBRA_00610 [Mycobacterium branderi]
MPYRLAPHVPLLVVKDEVGRNHHCYQHNTGVIPYLNDQQREHFLRLGLVEEIDDKPQPAKAEQPDDGEPAKPAKVASKEAWVDYGVSKGHDRAELEALNKQDLVELLG